MFCQFKKTSFCCVYFTKSVIDKWNKIGYMNIKLYEKKIVINKIFLNNKFKN